jgi:hypothetical protein
MQEAEIPMKEGLGNLTGRGLLDDCTCNHRCGSISDSEGFCLSELEPRPANESGSYLCEGEVS